MGGRTSCSSRRQRPVCLPACHLLLNLQPRPLYQMACPISASPSTDQVATSHLLWLNNQCKRKKKAKKEKKVLKKKKQSFEKAWQTATWFPSRTFRYFKLFYILSLLPMYKKNKQIHRRPCQRSSYSSSRVLSSFSVTSTSVFAL